MKRYFVAAVVSLILLFCVNIFAQSVASDSAVTDKFLQALAKKQIGKNDEAITLFEKLLSEEGDDAATMYQLAELYANLSEFDRAINLAQGAVKSDPYNAWYRQLLADIYLASGNLEAMVEETEQLVVFHPENLDYLQILAMAYLQNKQYSEAIEVYNQLESRTRVSEEVSMQKMQIYQLMGKRKKAFSEIEELVEAYPQNTRYHAILAELYNKSGETESAFKEYQIIKAIDPNDEYIDISLSDYYQKRGDLKRAQEYLVAGFDNPRLDIDTKIQILISILKIADQVPEYQGQAEKLIGSLVVAHPDNPKAWSIYADYYAFANDLEKTRMGYRKVIEYDSSRYVVWQQLLFAESELNDQKALLSESERAIRLFPVEPIPYLFNGMVYFQEKNYVRAIQQFERGKDYVFNNDALKEQFATFLGDAYHAVGENQKAYSFYEKALAINPSNSYVLNNYAYYLTLENSNLERAEEMALKSVTLDPGNPSNQDTYGWVLFKRKKYDEAKVWIQKAVQQSPNSTLYEHYGDVLFKLGKVDQAVVNWQAALDKMDDAVDKDQRALLQRKLKDKNYYE